MIRLFSALYTALSLMLVACSSYDVPNQVPTEISEFVSQYYPSYSYESYTNTSGQYNITLKSGPCLTFNSKMKWIEVNGNGQTLTQFFLFDQMPPAVYEYLQETENLENVYAVTRNALEYNVSLFDSVLTYTISNARISVSYG